MIVYMIMIVFNFSSGTVWTVHTSSTIVVKQQMANAVECISASNLIVVFTGEVQHSIQIFLLQQVCMFKICKRIQPGQNPFSCMRKITLSRSLLSNISKALFTTVYRFRYWHTSFVCSQDALHVSSTHRLHMHGNTLTLLCIPRTIRDFHAHLYVPWAIRDLLASIVLPKGRIDYIRPLGRIGFSCIYTSLGPYRINMHLYVPRELWQANMAWYFLQISSATRAV